MVVFFNANEESLLPSLLNFGTTLNCRPTAPFCCIFKDLRKMEKTLNFLVFLGNIRVHMGGLSSDRPCIKQKTVMVWKLRAIKHEENHF